MCADIARTTGNQPSFTGHSLSLTLYFFLYPVGHFGFTAVTFFVILPLTHEIVDFFTTGEAVEVGVGKMDILGDGLGLGDIAS